MKKTNRQSTIQLSTSQEDYLKEIFLLSERGEPVTTLALAQKIGVKSASVTDMIKKLVELGLVQRKPYQAIYLTEAGNRVALEILRHHRLLETFLAEKLGYRLDEVHGEAERLEHVISEQFEKAIARMLGHPRRDPHGDPIPTFDLVMPTDTTERTLYSLKKGDRAQITRIMLQDRQSLKNFKTLNLLPGTLITVLDKFEDCMQLSILGQEQKPIKIPLYISEKIMIVPSSLTSGKTQ
ncbi:DtxR family transcriptional regulator [Methylacidiphilum kamchatkense Kam1]|uniref:Transcriptional regulator MntR n=1 Tax=Methylacidiphilum kamchatkense Kam1 TaxID=1202785 RepID=A0A0C1V3Q8_9BACT|nr:metal-dependent transcriptional regulator [Methylacidiphilum kamchatkense]KIE58325.1 DtxR family transcriptional regulator [Methylacidiphilum kamchatkense Kam1]QDQ42273.1 DtxR family iron (metal) dependent repressor [Methylacidiphilum kamchatkense Kam1]